MDPCACMWSWQIPRIHCSYWEHLLQNSAEEKGEEDMCPVSRLESNLCALGSKTVSTSFPMSLHNLVLWSQANMESEPTLIIQWLNEILPVSTLCWALITAHPAGPSPTTPVPSRNHHQFHGWLSNTMTELYERHCSSGAHAGQCGKAERIVGEMG